MGCHVRLPGCGGLSAQHTCACATRDCVAQLDHSWYVSAPAALSLACAAITRECSCVVLMLPGLVCTFPSLLLVDQLHFQFNAWLLAGLVFTLACARQQAWACMAASFAALVCSKHIFAALGPMVCVVLLVHVLWQPIQRQQWRIAVKQSLVVAAVVAAVLAIVLIPVLLSCPEHFMRSVAAIKARLFPWDRGLTHAYWAPNMWALYNAADLTATKLLAKAVPLVQRWPALAAFASAAKHAELPYARGLVQDFGLDSHAVLPSPRPLHASLLTLGWMLVSESATPLLTRATDPSPHCTPSHLLSPIFQPAMIAYARRPTDSRRLYAMSWCFLGYFLWGWHVHEKALIYVTLPLLLAALDSSHEWVVQVLFIAPVTALVMLPLFTTPFGTCRCAGLQAHIAAHGLNHTCRHAVHYPPELWLGLALTALWCVAWYQHGSLWLRLVRYPATKHSARDVDPLQVLSAAQSMACVVLWCISGFYTVVMCIRAVFPAQRRLGEFYPLLSMSTAGAACVALLSQWLWSKLK